MRRTHRLPALGAGAVLTALVLTGCGAVADEAAEKVTEEISEQATGGEVDIDSEDGSVTIEGEGGSFGIGVGELPEGWPEVLALPDDAEVELGTTMQIEGADMLSVTFSTADSAEDVEAAWAEELSAAGYEEGFRSVSEDLITTWWSDGTQRVTFTGGPDSSNEGQTVVNAGYGADPSATSGG